MFQTVYDYPYLSSSANHIFDLTTGISTEYSGAVTISTQDVKKVNIYNELAQVLVGFDETGSVRNFDRDGQLVRITMHYFLIFLVFFLKTKLRRALSQ